MISIRRLRVVTVLVVAGTIAVASSGFAQTPTALPGQPAATGLIGVNLLGPIIGIYSGSLELSLDDEWSVFVVPTYFNVKASLIGLLIESAGVDRDDYDLWSLSGKIGLNYFLTDAAPTGLFRRRLGGSGVPPGKVRRRRACRRRSRHAYRGVVRGRWRRTRRLPGTAGTAGHYPARGGGLSPRVHGGRRRERGTEIDRQRGLQPLHDPVGDRPDHRLLNVNAHCNKTARKLHLDMSQPGLLGSGSWLRERASPISGSIPRRSGGELPGTCG